MQAASQERLWTRDFALLFAATLLAWTCHYFLVATLPLYAVQRVNANSAQVGVLMGMLAASAILSRLFAGYALDRWGRRWILLGSTFIFALMTFAYGFASGIRALILLRLLHGIPFGASTTACDTVASDLVPPARRGEGLGYFSLAHTLAMVIGPAMAWPVLGNALFERLFLVAGLTAVVAGVVAWFIHAPAVHNTEAAFSVRNMFESRAIWLASIMLFMALGYGSLMGFVGLYGSELGIVHAGRFFSVYAIGLLAARSLSGRLFDRHGPRPIVGSALALLSLSYASLALRRTANGYFAAALGQGMAFGAVSNALQAMSLNLVPASRRGAANATLYAMFDIGITVGASLLGLVAGAANSYASMYLVVASIMWIPELLFFVVILPRYDRDEV